MYSPILSDAKTIRRLPISKYIPTLPTQFNSNVANWGDLSYIKVGKSSLKFSCQLKSPISSNVLSVGSSILGGGEPTIDS